MPSRYLQEEDNLSMSGYRSEDYDDSPSYTSNWYHNFLLNILRPSFVLGNISNIAALVLLYYSNHLFLYGVILAGASIAVIPLFVFAAIYNKKKWYNGLLSQTFMSYAAYAIAIIVLTHLTHNPIWYAVAFGGLFSSIVILSIIDANKTELANRDKKRWWRVLYASGSLVFYVSLCMYTMQWLFPHVNAAYFLLTIPAIATCLICLVHHRKMKDAEHLKHFIHHSSLFPVLPALLLSIALLPLTLKGVITLKIAMTIYVAVFSVGYTGISAYRAQLARKANLDDRNDLLDMQNNDMSENIDTAPWEINSTRTNRQLLERVVYGNRQPVIYYAVLSLLSLGLIASCLRFRQQLSAYFINYVSPHLFLLFGFINDLFVRVSTKPTFALAAVSVAVTVAGFFVKSFRGVFGFMRRREEENIILQNEAANSNSHVTIPSPNNTEDNTESIHESVYFSSLENETSEITTDPLEDTIRQTDVIERKSIENRRGNANGIESPVNELEETLVCRLAKKFTWLSNRGSGVNSRTVISRTDQHQKSEASNTSEGLSSSHGKSLFR